MGSSDVRVKTGGYNTSPVHQDGKIRRWRASQDLILESKDIGAVSDLIGKLQVKLQLRSIGFTVSPESRRAVEDELIREALAAFRKRADLVRESLGANGYQIVRGVVDTGGWRPIQPRRMAQAAGREATVAPPALEGGRSELRVSVRGTIELE
jgi:predicted secreted protein